MPSQVFMPTFLYIKQHSVTGKLYFGKTTKNPEKYYGSGNHWTNHIRKHGKEHVVNLWYCLFLDKDDCVDFALNFSKQHKIVESKEWLNKINESGLDGSSGVPKIAVKDTSGNMFCVSPTDDRWLSGEVVGVNKNSKLIRDKMHDTMSGMISAKDALGNKYHIRKDDPRWLSGELVGIAKGTATVRDKEGNSFRIDVNDQRYIDGEFIGATTGISVTNEFREKMSKITKGRKVSQKVKDHLSKVKTGIPKPDGFGEAVSLRQKNKASAKDLSGNSLGHISIEDPRWKTGEIVGIKKKL